MRKLFSILLLLALITAGFACALEGNGYPAPDATSGTSNSFAGTVGGEQIALEFDPDTDYSSLADGYIQACFYAYDEKQENYLELYLLIPEDVTSGTTITDQTAASQGMELACVTVVEALSDMSETEYTSCVYGGVTYPEGSSFTLTVESIEKTDYAINVSGTVEATLLDLSGKSSTPLTVSGGTFNFSLPNGAADPSAPTATSEPATPAGSAKI